MIFCQIDQELINIIKKYADGRIIVDVGCGDGLLGSLIKDIISIDLYFRDTELIDNIIHMDAVQFPFNGEKTLPVFIRPCHGHFVDSILQSHKNNLKDCLYISMPHNIEYDIDEEFNIQQVEDWIGKDGERVFHIIF